MNVPVLFQFQREGNPGADAPAHPWSSWLWDEDYKTHPAYAESTIWKQPRQSSVSLGAKLQTGIFWKLSKISLKKGWNFLFLFCFSLRNKESVLSISNICHDSTWHLIMIWLKYNSTFLFEAVNSDFSNSATCSNNSLGKKKKKKRGIIYQNRYATKHIFPGWCYAFYCM